MGYPSYGDPSHGDRPLSLDRPQGMGPQLMGGHYVGP